MEKIEMPNLMQVLCFVDECDTEQACVIVMRLLANHPVLAFDPGKRTIKEVEECCLNGQCIQLNLEIHETDL